MTKGKPVTIPLPLFNKIKKRIDSSEFNDVNEYVTYVLEEVIKQMEEEDDTPEYSEEDEEKVKERLRALGYLD